MGADGGHYDVQGIPGRTYNILSDKGFQLNATFQGSTGLTLMKDIGATMGKDQVKIDVNGGLTINGQVQKDGTYPVDGGQVTKKGGVVTLQDQEHNVTITPRGGYLDLGFKSANVNADGVMPHGLWGQTADGDNKVRNGDQGGGAQGGGVLEKLDGTISARGDKTTFNLYEVADIFDTDFTNFNRFNG